jgi:hypothetical protein
MAPPPYFEDCNHLESIKKIRNNLITQVASNEVITLKIRYLFVKTLKTIELSYLVFAID